MVYYIYIAEAEGYEFGKNWGTGIIVYDFDRPITTRVDELALGFMTWQSNGTLIQIDSKDSNDYIEIKLVGAVSIYFSKFYLILLNLYPFKVNYAQHNKPPYSHSHYSYTKKYIKSRVCHYVDDITIVPK